MVEGTISVTKSDGTSEVKENKSFLCRCGHSSNKPYCDGAHKKNNFVG
jgi:CDGSH-type Zn-finger protein